MYDENDELYYCATSPTSSPTTPSPTEFDINECQLELTECESDNCAGDGDNPFCEFQYEWGCSSCFDGYWFKDHQYPCIECSESIANCQTCENWNGCATCQTGYVTQWTSVCGFSYKICVSE